MTIAVRPYRTEERRWNYNGFMQAVRGIFVDWRRREEGIAAMEMVLVFPILFTLLLGVYDLGNGFLVNQKVIASAQIMSDLIARNVSVTDSDLDDVVTAGKLALEPYDSTNMGYDIVSVSFDSDGDPVEEWRRTVNMSENSTAFDSTTALGSTGDGVIIVTVSYPYHPVFGGFVINTINMQETSFARGRRTPVVSKE